MKLLLFTLIIFLFFGCSKDKKQEAKIIFKDLPNTYLLETKFSYLPDWNKENHLAALKSFQQNCKSSKTKKLYNELCQKAKNVSNAKLFFENEFIPYKIVNKDKQKRELLTGYYEAELFGSLKKTKKYQYPIYETPLDLISVDLSLIYPELKHYRLRGMIKDNKLVPYYSRAELLRQKPKSKVICYVDSKIDLFFLEIQGSGRVTLSNGRTIFIGYANQNGYKYRAIGRYLIKQGVLTSKNVSLQSIRKYLEENPDMVDKVLNYNKSVVFFSKRDKPATGALGLELMKYRSIAVDRRYIPLGSLIFLSAEDDNKILNTLVNAQDTGGAIKGSIRADLFLGYGREAMEIAGKLKANLKLWILLPKLKERTND